MLVSEEIWGEIPLLHVHNNLMDAKTPTVLFLHGHMSAKEHNLHYAFQLVKKGIRVLLPDALYHGSRSQNLSELEMNTKFWDIVLANIKEVGQLYEEGQKRQIFAGSKIGLAGTSMGAISTSACLTQYSWIDSAAICMGVTSVTKLAEHQLNTIRINGKPLEVSVEQRKATYQMLNSFNLEAKREIFDEKPIIFWHGQKDEIIPFSLSNTYYEENLQNTRAQYIAEKNAAHAVSRSGILKVTEFLAQHLSE